MYGTHCQQGYAIQANMDVQDTAYFNRCVELNNAYKILGFTFPEHYFKFDAYIELEERADVRTAVLI
ncbi:hypothetical protein Tco_0530291, partial [Tanacetum coccineum]